MGYVVMANEHFWDNGVSEVSKEENCKLVYETLDGKHMTTPLLPIDKALKLSDVLKNGRETVSCEVLRVNGDEEQTIQSFKMNVIEVDGKKVII